MTKEQKGIPGLKAADHVGFTVPNLEQAVDFFVNVIGCETFHEMGPFQSDDDWMQTHLNVHPRSVLKRVKFAQPVAGPNFEIFEYEAPDQNHDQPRNSDVGGHHLAFLVEDMEAAVAFLKSKGIEVIGKPSVHLDGPATGKSWVYFLSPWGMQLELVSYPSGVFAQKP